MQRSKRSQRPDPVHGPGRAGSNREASPTSTSEAIGLNGDGAGAGDSAGRHGSDPVHGGGRGVFEFDAPD